MLTIAALEQYLKLKIGPETPNNQILETDKKQVELRAQMRTAAGREEGLEDKRYGPDQEAEVGRPSGVSSGGGCFLRSWNGKGARA